MTLEITELPSVTQETDPQSGRVIDVQGAPIEIPKVSGLIKDESVEEIDPNDPNVEEKIKRAREKYGHDEAISTSAKVILDKTGKVDAEVLARFKKIVDQSQMMVNLFTDEDLLNSINALLSPGKKVTFTSLYENGPYKEYLRDLAKILPLIKERTEERKGKLTLDDMQEFVRRIQALEIPDVPELKSMYEEAAIEDKPAAGVYKTDEKLFTLQKLGERAQNFLIRNGYERIQDANNLEEVVGIMMLSSDQKYRTGHKKELMNSEGEVQLHNLLAWFYEQLTYFSDFQDDDPLQAYQSIGFYTSFRQITAAELIIYAPKRYFSHRTDTGIKRETRDPETGEIFTQSVYENDSKFSLFQNLRNYLVTVVTNSGLAHDHGIQYEKAKEQREKWHDLMQQIYGEERSEFGNRMLRWLNLLGTSKDEVYAFLGSTKSDHETGGTVGQSLRRTLLAYNYFDQLGLGDLTDKDNMFVKSLGRKESQFAFFRSIMLQAISDNDIIRQQKLIMEDALYKEKQRLGKDFDMKTFRANPLYKEYFEYQDFIKTLRNKDTGLAADNIFSLLKADGGKILFSLHNKLGLDSKMLDPIREALKAADGFNGEVKLALELASVFRNYNQRALNYFDQPVQVAVRKEQREFIQNALGVAIKTEYKLSDEEAAYVQEFAMLMPGWLGLSSKNDASTNSLNFWGTMINFRDYRKDHMSQVFTGETESLNGILHFMTAFEALSVQVNKDGKVRTMSFLEYLQGGDGSNIETGIDDNRYARGEFLVNTGKKYWSEHLRGMMDMREFFYQHRGLDLGDIIKFQPGTGEMVIDEKKLDIFKKFWSAARNAFAKNGSIPWYTKVYVREKYEEGGKEKYRFVQKTLAEYIFHENVVGKYNKTNGRWEGGMNVNHGPTPTKWQKQIDDFIASQGEKGSLSKQGELFVRDLIGWAIMNSFMLHKYHLNPFTASKIYEKDPLWEKWELGQFQFVHQFFKHIQINSEEELVSYKSGPWWKFWEKGQLAVQGLSEGFFDDDDLKDISRKSKTTFGALLGYELGTGTSGSLFTFLWLLFKGVLGQNAKFK